MKNVAHSIISSLRAVLGEGSFALHEPRLFGNERRYVDDCIVSSFVSSVGRYVDRFESDLAAYVGVRRAVAVVNGTSALQVALKLAGVARNEEVIVPALTFVATANAVSYLGAIPHFADSEERSLGIDPEALRDWLEVIAERATGGYRNRSTGRRLRAVVPMHTFGHPCNMDGLLGVAHDYRLSLVEDAAESLGSYYRGRHTGIFGVLGVFSFNGNKILTTGGGGAIVTDSDDLANHAKHLTTTSKLPHRWDYVHDEIGYNYRMPNINAALGCAQLEQLPLFLKSKRQLFVRYQAAFADVDEVCLFEEPIGCKSNYWLQTLLLSENTASQRDVILEAINNAGFMSRPAWRLMHRLDPYRHCPRAPLSVAESLERRIINLPSSVGLAA